MSTPRYTHADTVTGYIKGAEFAAKYFDLSTSDGGEYRIHLSSTTNARITHNLGEEYQDCTSRLREMLKPGQLVYVYGVFYPQQDQWRFEAESMVFPGDGVGVYRHEEADWWIKQLDSIAGCYMRWQFDFPNQSVDFRNYRTILQLAGTKKDSFLQETDTMSRLIYGLASAYMLTGNESYLEGAERGTDYLRQHVRFYDPDEELVYWYHGISVAGEREQKLLTSEFGDDFDSIPMYEQIYALAGPCQTFRITGDPRILYDMEKTIELFDKYYKDNDRGGYFSHIDPITLDPRSPTLDKGNNRARKNWNSVGDHAPAYLINLWLATGEERYLDFLASTADTICAHFPDDEHSPFVQERFFEDWSADTGWNWQQDRAVVGHNLKIAWNLTRINNARPNETYTALAQKIAHAMPPVGSDRQRGGWYDVVERRLQEGEEVHRFAWHDRKAWWQQEQAILAYFILHGCLGDHDFQKHGREAAAFYNAFFLDHDDGAIYFNVLANGLPYLLGNERLKGSHSMSAYHSSELCFLSAIYLNLLTHRQPLDLYFRPRPEGFAGRILRVAPDILPKGSVQLSAVEIDGRNYTEFDRDEMFVQLPDSRQDLRVRVTLTPAQ